MHLCLGTTPTVQQTMIFDRLSIDAVNRAATVLRGASGKPINVARVLHLLGEKSRVCVPLGGDTGRFIRQRLDDEGIEHRCLEVAAPTRTCVTIINRADGAATELVEEPAPLAADVSPRMLATLRQSLAGAAMLVLSGSLAPRIGEDFYAECCRAAGSDVPVILDAAGHALQRALPLRPLVVKPNRAELTATLGKSLDHDADLRAAMCSLHEQGAQWVLVTAGRQGALLCDGADFWQIPALPIPVVSPIGSGDAFAAGLAAGIARGQSVPDACRLGAAAAAANAMVPGSGLLDAADAQRLLPQVRVERC
jgi:1-phosphofructokinase family hexose kinase